MRHSRLAEAGKLLLKRHHAVGPFTVFVCYTVQDISQLAVVDSPRNVVDGLPLFVALMAEENVVLRFFVMAMFHEALLHTVLDVLDSAQLGIVSDELFYFTDHSCYFTVWNIFPCTDETLLDGC